MAGGEGEDLRLRPPLRHRVDDARQEAGLRAQRGGVAQLPRRRRQVAPG
ncbi:hypothetical protein HMPREF0731_4446, partial [Pseudoroseomonas cervicalis ATCC 49957]